MSGETNDPQQKPLWATGETYEPYVGRWSRLVAHVFLEWLAIPTGQRWLDVGCGTGALSQTILKDAAPVEVKGVDRSEGYITYAQQYVIDKRASFQVGDAQALPINDGEYHVAVSGLVLNFVPQPDRMVAEMVRCVESGGQVALYVWDYADKMELIRYFWNAATALNPKAQVHDEGRRFPICNPAPLAALFQATGLQNLETRAIDVPTDFRDFDDYWLPFLGGQAPAPAYAMSLNEEDRVALREQLRAKLPVAADGGIHLIARAWAVRGTRV